ncbi:hypothetical protein EJB05_03413 [Eragrostis curvula]|uniref:RRM domain-containing protein n=1 Tax=Eragrostis curvula TaxID=38414 RepID=A0A5J9W7L8_9POAL|nr:hypothetical protein EJB05_03413 [Eragrostis curvula]
MAEVEEYRCFIGNLSWSTTDESLRDAFGKFGKVTEAKYCVATASSILNCDYGVLVLGHAHQRRLHRGVVLQRLPAAIRINPTSAAGAGHRFAMVSASAAAHLYRQTRWWTKTQISRRARLMPGHIRGPLPNPRKLYGLSVCCTETQIRQHPPWAMMQVQFAAKLTSNLSGSNRSGSAKTAGSWWMDTTSRFTEVPFLISCPASITHFSQKQYTSVGELRLTRSFSRTSGFSPRNLMSHVRPAVVVSCPATSRVRMLSLSCESVSLSVSSPAPSLACFLRSVWRKSFRTSPPSLLLDITESSISYIRPRWKAVPGSLRGKDAKEDEMTLKLARNFSCSSPSGSKLISMLAITFNVN